MRRETAPGTTDQTQPAVTATIVDRPRLGPQPEPSAARKRQPPRTKHVPQRTCVACRDKEAKRTLTRLVRTTDGPVEIDPTGKRNGRGAYLCSQRSCWERALATPVLARALKTEIDQPARDAMTAHLAALPE